MTNADLIQRFKSLYDKGASSDDSRLSKRHIYNVCLSVRSRLLSQKINKRQKVSQWTYQTLDCVELIKAPIHECPCIPNNGCQVLRSKYPLPSPLVDLGGHIIQYVTALDGQINFDESAWEVEKYSKGNKYTSKKPSFYIKNEYLYITNTSVIEVITMGGIFNDPIEASKFPSMCEGEIFCPECECNSYLDMDFPIDGDLVEPLVELATRELIEIFGQMREDQTNDAKDNLTQESKS